MVVMIFIYLTILEKGVVIEETFTDNDGQFEFEKIFMGQFLPRLLLGIPIKQI